MNLKLHGDISLLDHFSQFEEITTELIAAGAKLDEMDKISHLLLTLPTSYEGVITALETLSDKLITLIFVKTRLLDHEVKLKAEVTSTKVLQANSIMNTNSQNFDASNYRKKFNHDKRYKNYGYFEHRSNYKKYSNIKCHHWRRKNHVKADCLFYQKQQNNFKTNKQNRKRILQTVQSSTAADDFAFMSKVNNGQDTNKTTTNSNIISFIWDSAATDHLINRMDIFTSSIELSTPLKISVAKQDVSIMAFRRGSI